MTYLYSFIIIIYNLIILIESRPYCLDENSSPLDWYVVYKLPRLRFHKNPLVQSGEAYLYFTNNSLLQNQDQWIISQYSINDSKSFPAQTLSQKPSDGDWLEISYNDQPPNKLYYNHGGHAKGTIFASEEGGFWLIHSVPHLDLDPFNYPHTATHYGQSMLCLSLNPEQLNSVGNQLLYAEIHIFLSKIPSKLESLYSNLMSVLQNETITQPPWFHTHDLFPSSKGSFRIITKNSKFGKDLYSELVAPSLNSNLLVESWQNGHGRLASNCSSSHIVKNISKMKLANATFSSHLDHSKLAMTSSNGVKEWICIGDINRMETQFNRGGGTVCIQIKELWNIYKSSVFKTERCPILLLLKNINYL